MNCVKLHLVGNISKKYEGNFIITAHRQIVGDLIDASEIRGAQKEKLRETKCLKNFISAQVNRTRYGPGVTQRVPGS